MPDAGAQLESLATWLQDNWLVAIIVAVAAFVAFRLVRPVVHRAVMHAVRVRTPEGADAALLTEEADKRAETIEDLLARLLKAVVIVVVALVAMTMLGLLPVIAGLGILAAALTLAGQTIVLDYLMGFLILVEGQYYQGDWISVGDGRGDRRGGRVPADGDPRRSGTVHSVSNGEIRISSNLTRLYASLQVDVPVVPGTDIDRAAAIVDRVGAEMAADPAWKRPPARATALRPGDRRHRHRGHAAGHGTHPGDRSLGGAGRAAAPPAGGVLGRGDRDPAARPGRDGGRCRRDPGDDHRGTRAEPAPEPAAHRTRGRPRPEPVATPDPRSPRARADRRRRATDPELRRATTWLRGPQARGGAA